MLGGITTGSPLVCRVGFKPTSTIALPQLSVRKDLEETERTGARGRELALGLFSFDGYSQELVDFLSGDGSLSEC
jgi:hypothetical protein